MPLSVDVSEWDVERGVGAPVTDVLGGERAGDVLTRTYNFSGLQAPDTTAALKIHCRLESDFGGVLINSTLYLFFWPLRLRQETSLFIGLVTADESEGGIVEVLARPVEGTRDTALFGVGAGKYGEKGRRDTWKCLSAILSGKEMFFVLGNQTELMKLPLPNDGEFQQLYTESRERIKRAQDANRGPDFFERRAQKLGIVKE